MLPQYRQEDKNKAYLYQWFLHQSVHDAVGVRRETGKQAVIINELKKLLSNEKIDEIKLKEFVGHTPVQVFAGVIVGIITALIMNLII